MEISLGIGIAKIFILGAGSSVDYGLPTWKELSVLLKKEIEDNGFHYKYKKEILNWLNKVGEGKEYKTIDECITIESESEKHHENGEEIQNEIFLVMKNIFNNKTKNNKSGWIKELNKKIRDTYAIDNLKNKVAFINYNYDNVLLDNFLNPNSMSQIEKNRKYKHILEDSIKIKCIHPHGYFIENNNNASLELISETMKSDDSNILDAISCYDRDQYIIKTAPNNRNVHLYILGLGGGLEVNLGKLNLKNIKIATIHITSRNKENHQAVQSILKKKFHTNGIYFYESCNDLINKCF